MFQLTTMFSSASEHREGATLLEVNGLRMSVKAETNLFHDVGFKLHEGDILILQGKSGSG